MRVYRFRSIGNLFGKFQELEKQTIYFARPDELNDPMEGFRDIVWRGDKIVWTNLFKNYISYLLELFYMFRRKGDSKELNVDDIKLPGRWDREDDTTPSKKFKHVWETFLNLPNVREIIEEIAKTSHGFRDRELELFLRLIHPVLLPEIEKTLSKRGLTDSIVSPCLPEGLPTAQELSELILKSVTRLKEAEGEGEINDVLWEVERWEVERMGNKISLQVKSPVPTGILWTNFQLVHDFPKIYVNRLDRLLFPKWYTACFSKCYHSSSMWANYGDAHRGACLIFEPATTDGSSNGLFPPPEDVTAKAMRSFDIRYAAKPMEIDFFRLLALNVSSLDKLMEVWYTDEKGNTSECASHIQSDGVEDQWYERIWDQFHDGITIKTKDWKYEQEHRLTLRGIPGHYDDEESRKIPYEFNSLKGIIFGIKTSDEDKLRIIDIVQEKCKKHKRTNFKFYQAYHSSENGDIRKHEIQLS